MSGPRPELRTIDTRLPGTKPSAANRPMIDPPPVNVKISASLPAGNSSSPIPGIIMVLDSLSDYWLLHWSHRPVKHKHARVTATPYSSCNCLLSAVTYRDSNSITAPHWLHVK